MYSAAVNEKPICRPSTDTGLDLWFSQTLHFCPIGNLCPTKRVFSLSVQGGRRRRGACTFLTQLAGPCFPGAPLALLAPRPPLSSSSSPLSSSLVLSALLCRCQSLTPFKEQTLCCAMIADVSSRGDWQPGLLTSSPGVAGRRAGWQECVRAHEIWWYIGMRASVCVCALRLCLWTVRRCVSVTTRTTYLSAKSD